MFLEVASTKKLVSVCRDSSMRENGDLKSRFHARKNFRNEHRHIRLQQGRSGGLELVTLYLSSLTVQETDGLWRIMDDYQKHNQVMSHIVVAVSMYVLIPMYHIDQHIWFMVSSY